MKELLKLVFGKTFMTKIDLKVGTAGKSIFITLAKEYLSKYWELVTKLNGVSFFLVIATLSNFYIFGGLFSFLIVIALDYAMLRVVLNSK